MIRPASDMYNKYCQLIISQINEVKPSIELAILKQVKRIYYALVIIKVSNEESKPALLRPLAEKCFGY
jgi:hypothetical protein